MPDRLVRLFACGVLVLLSAFAPLALGAQTEPGPWLISVLAGGGKWFRTDVESAAPKSDPRALVAAQLDYAVAGPFSLGLMGSAAVIPGACSGGCDAVGIGIDVSVRVRLVPSRAGVWPYAFAGYGVLDQDSTFGRWHLGLGLDMPAHSRVGVRMEYRYLIASTARPRDGFAVMVGPSIRF
jgi:opacity protein-like surface antigen